MITGASKEGATEIVRIEVGPVPTVFVAETVTENVPNTAGVPPIAPVPDVSVRPAGKPVAE